MNCMFVCLHPYIFSGRHLLRVSGMSLMKPRVPRRGGEKTPPRLFPSSHSLSLSVSPSSAVCAVNLSPTDIKERHRGRDITGVKRPNTRRQNILQLRKRRHVAFQFTSISDLFKPVMFHLSVLSPVFHFIYSFIYLHVKRNTPHAAVEKLNVFGGHSYLFGLMRM